MLRRIDRKRLACSLFFTPLAAAASGYLENPQPGSIESGIGLVSGWHCTAKEIVVSVDGVSLGKSGVGSIRNDTESICGHPNTGFSLLYNYNIPQPGTHVIRVYADGALMETRTFTSIRSAGVPFMSGANKRIEAGDFPQVGSTAILDWSQAKQSFVVTEIRTSGSGASDPESACGKTALLAGSWKMDFTIISKFTENYSFDADSLAVTGDSDLPCLILGYDSYGNFDVSGAYASSLGRWLILDEGISMDEAFEMSFTTSSRMDGFYRQRYSDGSLSSRYAAVATRTAAPLNLETQSLSNMDAGSAEKNALSEMSVMDTLKAKAASTVSKQADFSDDTPDLGAIVERLQELTRSAAH
ncbi:hypothetical protein ebA570 [Aromatoleum aromaticum EbN1]|uniref:Secreted protein n=1 Tax=Aromatoleum aromaticum (strain DSM 19018 / LMG 30748 / EbN1) TaxID=76114 RepID=Q5P8E0_AROAE|nr:hypothetical protein [Aromatoleum aromaticum]CAI06419.1 hypothetical protein ebA570 [Aromatoleum aromaticum EbN1]